MTLRHLDEFTPYVEQSFEIVFETVEPMSLVLTQAISMRYRGGPGRDDPFRLTFRSTGDRMLAQGNYRLSHPAMGDVEIFLVPTGISEGATLYDALFN